MALPQSLSAQVERYREDWRWTSYGPDAGLTGGPVARFLETPAGEIWAVTAGGIFRYDGFQWQAGTALGLPAGHATAAPLDTSESELLVVVAGRVFQGGAQGFTETSTIGTNPIPTDLDSLTALDNGDILLAISESGLIFRPSTDSLGPVISPRENARIAAGGGALFARVGVSLWFRADEDWVPVPAGTVDPPRAWVGSDEALFGFRSSARTTRGLWEWTRGSAPRQIPGQATRVAALTVGPGGDAIVTSTTGAVHLRVDGMWQEMGYPSSQLAEANALHYSTSGDLWTATHDIVHLYRSDDGLWSHPPIVGDLEVQSILVTRDGSVWVGTESGLTISRPNGRRETTGTIGGDSLQVISGLAEDSAGNVWVSSGATFRGIYRWNGDSWRHFGAADGFTNANVHRIIPGRDGRLWLMVLDNEVVDEGADRSGVWYYDASGFHRLATETGKALGRSYDMAEGSDGTLWFGTVTGLYRLAGNEWTSWTDADGLAFNRVFTVAVDGTGTPWFGHQSMGGGLGTVGPGDSVSYETTHDYLLSDEVHGIDVDAGGIVWFTTDRGVGRREDGVFTSFDRGTGLGHQLLWALTLAGDSIWVGSMGGGVFVLRPGNASGYPPVVAGHQPLISDNVAVQRWTPLSYKGEIPSDNILTRHRLAGETWSDWSTARRVFAYDLNPGEYAFSVQARDHFGNISDPIKLPVFTISPPIYRHPLVIGIVAVWLGSMIFIAIVFLRRRKAQLAEVTDRERHFRSLIENATDLITVLAEDGTVLYESPSSERLLGSPPEGLRGAAALQLIHDDDRPAVEAELARAFENPGTMHSMEFRFRHRDGRWIDLESIGRVNPEHASPRRIVLNSRDITLRKSAERAMEELQAE